MTQDEKNENKLRREERKLRNIKRKKEKITYTEKIQRNKNKEMAEKRERDADKE